jgi:hypothetical protein
MENIHLPHTLQTWVGMVANNGLPQVRANPPNHSKPALKLSSTVRQTLTFPYFTSFTDIEAYNFKRQRMFSDVAEACLRQERSFLPYTKHEKHKSTMNELARFSHNIEACRSRITIHELMRFITTQTRMDLEQGAGAVVSAFFNEGRINDAVRLLHELTGVLTSSSMWIEDAEKLPNNAQSTVALGHLATKLQTWCEKANAMVDFPGTYADILAILLRVRRVAPADRCLQIPEWIFEEAKVQVPEHMRTYHTTQASNSEGGDLLSDLKGRLYPRHPCTADAIVLSRKTFRALQRRIFRLLKFWKPEVQLRRSIRNLEDQVLYASDWISQRLRETEDVAQVAFWFVALQRRLQKKVVSDVEWSSFLVKGEGAKLYQNNLRIQSTFERVLAEIAGQSGLDTMATGENTLSMIDQTCLLMKRYVDVYGEGEKENLVYQREQRGQRGGKGRGSADEYNLLCDILRELKDRAKDEGIQKIPGPVYKFLAKDIMNHNNSFGDDAFAGGKIHGWELWIAQRQLA